MESGVDAAAAAAAGLLLDDSVVLPNVMDAALAARAIGDGEIAALAQKPFCTSRQALSGAAAYLALNERERIDPAQVAHVRVEVPRDYAWMIENPSRAGERLSTATSQAFQVAAAALDHKVLYDVVRAGPFSDAVLAFEKRVEVVATDAFDNVYPRLWPARITVRLNDGSEQTLTLEHPPGDPETPLTFEQLQAKSPAYTAEIHELCERAVTEGPAALLRHPDVCAATACDAGSRS